MKDFNRFNVSYKEFREQFETINNPVDTALIATIYCGYARVGEIVRGRYNPTPCIQRSDVEFTPKHLFLTIHTEKIKSIRKVPTSRALEDWLHEPIRNHLNVVEGNNLFDYSTRWAEKRFEKCFGTQHIHLLRHWACTHALQGHRSKGKLAMQDIARLGGWSNTSIPFKVYGHFVTEDIARDV